jgi:hypothetical protein
VSLSCLRCGHGIDQDFGLVVCTQCGAVMSIDFDGHLQMADGPEIQGQIADGVEIQGATPNISETSKIEADWQNFEPNPIEPLGEFEDRTEVNQESGAKAILPEGQLVGELSLAGIKSEMDDYKKGEHSLDYPIKPSEPDPFNAIPADTAKQNFTATQAFAEIIEFANSEGVTALSYDLSLKGLEDPEVRQKVLTILSGSRLQMDPQKVENLIEDGTLKLQKLNAGTISFILHHVLDLPVVPSWKQHLYNR